MQCFRYRLPRCPSVSRTASVASTSSAGGGFDLGGLSLGDGSFRDRSTDEEGKGRKKGRGKKKGPQEGTTSEGRGSIDAAIPEAQRRGVDRTDSSDYGDMTVGSSMTGAEAPAGGKRRDSAADGVSVGGGGGHSSTPVSPASTTRRGRRERDTTADVWGQVRPLRLE